MVLVDIGLMLGGLVLLFAGAALSIYAVAFLGFLIGAGGGYVLAPQLLGAFGAEGLVGLAVAVVVGGLLGAGLSYVALSFATAIPAFVVGAFIGLEVGIELLGEGWLRYVGMIVGGIVGSVLGFTFTKFALIFITAFVGAALASGSVTLANIQAVRDELAIEAVLFEPFGTTPVAGVELPLFAALFVLGILSQIGLFKLGWVAKLATVLPGVSGVLRSDDDDDSA